MKINQLLGILIVLLFFVNTYCQDFYDINSINIIELTFEQSNWDYLLDSLFADRNENRLMGTAFINGIRYDSVGVRYKGNSSYNPRNIKNPLNIKLDYIIDDQEHEGYGTLKLANGFKDPSFVREVLSYEIAREYIPASQANFCKVYVNNTYLGLYSSVQDVDKHFARTHFFSGDNAFFKGELIGGETPTSVKVWGYFGTDSAIYHNYYEMESDYGWAELIEFLDILNNNPEEVENFLNVDRHLWMLAFDILTVNLDAPVNFAHNYYLYKDDAGRFNPIIWDLNENFGVFTRLIEGGSLNITGMQIMDPFLNTTLENYPIINKILSNPVYKKMYVAHMKTIMTDWFSNGRYRTRAMEIQDIIDSKVQNDPNSFYTFKQFKENIDISVGGGGPPGPGNQSIVGLSQLMDSRIAYLNAQYEFQVSAPEINNITNNPIQVIPNTDVWITAKVNNVDLVQLAFRYSHTDVFKKVEMLDDGSHNDGAAGDSVYGVSVPVGSGGFKYYIYAENDLAACFSPERAEYEYYMLTTAGDIVINEFMAANNATVSDFDGEYDDWIELYNNTDNDLSLAGYYLSDDGKNLTQWTFPDTVISANSYLIVWADKDEEQDGLHTNFKLSGSGEAIYFVNSDTNIVDEVTFGEQTIDISTGRYPNGTGSFVQMNPTFLAVNQDGITSIIDDQQSGSLDKFSLAQNYPNPFNPSTTIRFSLPEAGRVSLKIYNITGQLITTLVDRQLLPGLHEFQWRATDLPSGIYFYSLTSGSFKETKRMILLK